MHKKPAPLDPGGLLGPAFLDVGWVPAPGYVLRRSLVLEQLHKLPRGKVLEVGVAVGALAYELSKLGWDYTAFEASPEGYARAKRVLAGSDVVLLQALPEAGHVFDYVMAFEVLEHIQDDHAVLGDWLQLLKAGGYFFLSVPAHMRMWSATDESVGHFRRYSHAELVALFESRGCRVEYLVCYGWPLKNMLMWLRGCIEKKKANQPSMAQRTEESGINRQMEMRFFRLYSSLAGRMVLRVFLLLQHLTLRKDWGAGYFLIPKKLP